MTKGTRTLGPRLAWAVVVGVLVAIAGLLTFHDSPRVFGQQPSTDATLSGLTLSGIDFGTFDSETLQYTVQVGSLVDQTVVTVTRNHSKATYLVKLGGVTETDGVVSLSAGSNVITVEVTAEDGQTMRTYSVTVTRPVSDNAYLYDLTLSGVAIEHGSTFYPPGFSALVFNYAPSVAHSLTETTVTPRVAHSFATYIIKLDGVTDADGVIALSVGRNVITIEVTAEDGETTKTYTITVTRAPAPMTDATLKSLLLSGIDIGSGMGIGKIVPTDTSYKASVYHSVSQTTVTPTVNHSGASYVIKLGGVEDADGTISLAVGSNVITVEVTAEDDSTTKTYTATVNRATASAPTTGELSSDDPPVNFRATDVFSDHTIVVLAFPRNRGITGWVLQRYEHDGDEFVSSGSAMRSAFTGSKDLGGEGLRVGNSEVEPGALYKWVAQLRNSQGSTVIETSLTVRIPSDETTELSSDATLSSLTLSGIDFGTFDSETLQYTVQVGSHVDQTVVTVTRNHSKATYLVKLGGVTETDDVVSLSAGSNVITVEVTAEDGQTMRTYSITITRSASSDATLEYLDLSGIDIGDGIGRRGTYVGNQTSFNASVYHSISQTTVTPTVNHPGASFVVKLGGVEDADRSISMAVGSNVITIEVTAEDGQTTKTYTATVNRATASAPTTGELATDDPPVNFRAIYVSKTFAGFSLNYPRNRGLFGWVGQRYEHDGDSFVSSGADSRYEFSDSDDLGGLSLDFGDENVEPGARYKWVAMLRNSQGSTVIETSVTVRIPPDETTELSSDATLSDLTLTGMELQKTGGLHAEVAGFASSHLSYAAGVAYSLSQTTVAPTVNHSGTSTSYVIKLDGVTDEDGVISLSVGSNIITVEVTAEDGETTQTYTVAVTRAAALSTDATLNGLTLSGVDFGTFASDTTSYTASVANSVSQTTVTPTMNHSGASYVIKLDGVTDADGVISLSVRSNIITIEVTAEDGETTRTYTVAVTRAAALSTDATLNGLTLSGVDFGTFASGTTSYTASVANSVSQTSVTPTVNHSGASYVIKLDGVEDADGVVSLSVGSNVITVELTAEDDSTTQTYTVTVTREGLPTEETEEETEQRMRVQYDANENGAIDPDEVITAVIDYFDGLITGDEVLAVVKMYFRD